jgi:hypothetical protein
VSRHTGSAIESVARMSAATSGTALTSPRMSLRSSGLQERNGETDIRMKPVFVGAPHSIPLSSSSAFLINSSLTAMVGRGTRKNIAEAHAIDSAKIAAVSGSVVVEWPPR